jgi:hypothetical protein
MNNWCKLPEGKTELWLEYLWWRHEVLQKKEYDDIDLYFKEEEFAQELIDKRKIKDERENLEI